MVATWVLCEDQPLNIEGIVHRAARPLDEECLQNFTQHKPTRFRSPRPFLLESILI